MFNGSDVVLIRGCAVRSSRVFIPQCQRQFFYSCELDLKVCFVFDDHAVFFLGLGFPAGSLVGSLVPSADALEAQREARLNSGTSTDPAFPRFSDSRRRVQ